MPTTNHIDRSTRAQEVLHATAAACAIIAIADGHIAIAERNKFISCVMEYDLLQEFTADEMFELFKHHEMALAYDIRGGLEDAFAMIRPLAHRPADAKALVEICWSVLIADQFAHHAECHALDAIRRALGLLPPGPAAAALARPASLQDRVDLQPVDAVDLRNEAFCIARPSP